MQGSIAFDGTLSGSIAGGGGGGSEVTITPTLTEGEKIADYEIDGTPGELYAPTPSVVPEHIVTDIHGFSYTPYPSTEVARYTIDDGAEQSIYTPDYETTWEAYPGVAQDYTIGILRCYGSTYNVKIPYYQKQLTAGTNISIDPVTNVISAASVGINYSPTEQWIGSFLGEPLYQITIESAIESGQLSKSIPFTGLDMKGLIDLKCLFDGTILMNINGTIAGNTSSNYVRIRSNSAYADWGYIDDTGVTITRSNVAYYADASIKLTIQYTKNS